MSKRKIKIGAIDLTRTVNALFVSYGQDVNEVLYESMQSVADEAVKELKSVNKFAPNGHPTGEYSESWDKVEQQTSRLAKSVVVYNEEHYRLTHLLENGHALKRGGRTIGSVKAYPHIYPVEQKVVKDFEREVIERITDLNTL